MEENEKENGNQKRVETGAEIVPAPRDSETRDENSRTTKWHTPCYHQRWAKLDKKKFKDRIVWLKECRRCGKKKAEVIYVNLNARKVYTGRDVFAINPVSQDPHERND